MEGEKIHRRFKIDLKLSVNIENSKTGFPFLFRRYRPIDESRRRAAAICTPVSVGKSGTETPKRALEEQGATLRSLGG